MDSLAGSTANAPLNLFVSDDFQSPKTKLNESRDDGGRATPVPIPNTEVKSSSAESTWWVTAWEDRTLRDFFCAKQRAMRRKILKIEIKEQIYLFFGLYF